MNEKGFEISGTWDPRPDPPEKLGRRMLTTLDALADVSPHFGEWRFTDKRVSAQRMMDEGLSDEEMMKRFAESNIPLEDARNRMSEIVEYGTRRDDFGNPEGGGYHISAMNYVDESAYGVWLTARGGGVIDPRAGLRGVEFRTTADRGPDPAIVTYPVFKAALLAIVSGWNPRYAKAYPEALRTAWTRRPYSLSLDLSWMTYLSPEVAKGYVPPGGVLVEAVENGGILLIAAEETFDVENPRHMSSAQTIRDSLAAINLAEERTAQLLYSARSSNH